MKIFTIIFSALTVFLVSCFSVFSQDKSVQTNNNQGNNIRLVNPLYELRVANIHATGTSPAGINNVFFDIYIYHTNFSESGPFEYSAGQFYLDFNPFAVSGSSLVYTIVPNSSEFTNPDAVPVNPSISGDQLRLERNPVLGPGNGPIVSSVFPGTRVVRLKLQSTENPINPYDLDFRWRDSISGDPYTQTFAYIDSISTDITGEGTMIVDSVDAPLPVELSNFNAAINENNAVLNWTTDTETNNYGFDIERNLSDDQWTKIGFIHGNGTSSVQNNYSFNDNNLKSGTYKYRLKQIDYNGNYEYFNLSAEVVIGVPSEFSLKQNYPNPFNPVTRIDFRVPETGNVILKIFDNSGKLLSTLLNQQLSSGYHSVNFNASDYSSGIYYYRLEYENNGNQSSGVMKMVLLK